MSKKRCRIGDVCITRNPLRLEDKHGNAGRFCTIVRKSGIPGLDWTVEIPGKNGLWAAMDIELIPLRDRRGPDEMLRIAGKPASKPKTEPQATPAQPKTKTETETV